MKNLFNFLNKMKNIPQNEINQNEGEYNLSRPRPCCFGAHLSNAFNLQKYKNKWDEEYSSFTDGEIYFYEKTGMDEDETSELFFMLGITKTAAFSPFSRMEWKLSLSEAITELETCGEFVLEATRFFHKNKGKWPKWFKYNGPGNFSADKGRNKFEE